MDATRLSTVLALIPDRTIRQLTGAHFHPESSATRHPERLPHIARLLGWMTPLTAPTVHDQRVLGLVNAAGRPVHASDLEEGGAADGEAADREPDEPGLPGRVEHALA